MPTCPDCGLGYVAGHADDERVHRKRHNQVVNGVPARPLKSDQAIWVKGAARITVVTPLSAWAQRVRARKAAQVANFEVRHDFGIYDEFEAPDERDLHIFLYHENDRIVGMALLERRTHIWRSGWTRFETRDAERLADHPPVWSLAFVWVHRRQRRRGIARRLFAEAARYVHVDAAAVGLYTPFSESGEALARALFPGSFLIAR